MRHLPLALLLAAPALAQRPYTPIPANGPATLTPRQQLARDILRELVEINTADSVGSATLAAEAAARRFREAGFADADVRVLVPDGKPTKGNLVVRYRGRAGASLRPILLLAHLDVVRANRADWRHDPFVLREEGGYFLGRGTADDKGMASALMANLLVARREGWVPSRDVILALTADEEGGPDNGVRWLLAEHRELVDAAYAINEGADEARDASGKPLYMGIQAAEKVSQNFQLRVTNPGGHSSQPRPDNAIYQLAHALGRIEAHRFPVALNAISRAYFERTATVETPAVARAIRAVLAAPTNAAALATLDRSVTYRSLLRTTCVATRLAGGHANNALPQSATATVNCRIVPTSSPEAVMAELRRVVADTGVHVEPVGGTLTARPATPTPMPAELLGAASEAVREMWGDVPVYPMMSQWATDGAYLRAGGIPTFGVSGMFLQAGEDNAHGLDEKLPVRTFYEMLEFLDRVVRRVAGPGAA